MTLVAAWTRTSQRGGELWVISDSRLSGGKYWDFGPKIFGIGRSDGVIAFAGDTAWTYPLIAQISSYVESFVNLRERVIDLADAFDLIIRMLNESLNFIFKPADPSLRVPDCSFCFAGYSSRRKNFVIRRIAFNPKRSEFEGVAVRKIGGELISIIGDKEPAAALARRISERRKAVGGNEFKLGMVPAEEFYEILSSKKFSDIGGAPQIAKVYQNMSTMHFGVYWSPDLPIDEQRIYLRGRRLGKYDVLDHPWIYDPSSTKLFWHDFSPDARIKNSMIASEFEEMQTDSRIKLASNLSTFIYQNDLDSSRQ